MIIPVELAQKIVDSAMCLVHRNVNIMNREGIIIATGHPHRLNTFHKGALDVIETGSVIEIFPHELTLYPGALQGINLPIVLDDQVVGVVGVFGNPDEVRDTGRLVKTITELILERDLLQIELRTKNRLREELLEAAVTNPSPEQNPKMRRIAKALRLNLALPRIVVVIDISAAQARFASEYGLSELVSERVEESILQNIADGGLMTDDDVAAVLDEKLVILKTLPDGQPQDEIVTWVKDAKKLLPAGGEEQYPAGIGAVARTAVEYNPSFRQALFCLKHCQGEKQTRSIKEKDLLVRYASREALTPAAQLAMNDIRGRFRQVVKENPEMKNTLENMLNNNLDINITAAQLHIHRNTLLYRLTRINAETGLDPAHNIDDLVLCRFLLDSNDD
jgi:carbohydrate diacid regulator